MATYIIGDIHAGYEGLMKLLNKVSFCRKEDTLVAVGDLIGRGPDAERTLAFLCDLGDQFTTVLGNHDLHFLAVSQGLKKAKSDDGFEQVLQSKDCQRYIQWLRSKPLAYQLDDNTLICHAGLYPQWTFKKALRYSRRISEKLQSEHWCKLLNDMYKPTTNHWSSDLKGVDKDNFIINAFTRMRFLTVDGQLDLDAKSNPKDTSNCLLPWFSYASPSHKKDQKIIFGHWAALNGATHNPQYIGLDTGYIWGNKLTLLRVEDDKIFEQKNKEN